MVLDLFKRCIFTTVVGINILASTGDDDLIETYQRRNQRHCRLSKEILNKYVLVK